nr:diguanylate cyclase [Ilumatobacter sp.]
VIEQARYMGYVTTIGGSRRHLSDLNSAEWKVMAKAERQLKAAPAGQYLAMVDIDNFKMFNDIHGHAAGDDVLRRVGYAIAASVRCDDVAYRYGGEEFCVLLPDATADEAGGVAERVRRAIEAIEAPYGTKVTASVGVASGPSTHLPATAATADAALFRAKHAGRNRVAVDPRSGNVPTTSN